MGGIEDITDEAWSADLDLKVRGPARFLRVTLPYLRSAPAPAIVNVLAIAAKAALENSMPSSASRAAGLAMTKALSRDLGPSGVRVNAILIGLVESGQWRRKAEEAGEPEAEYLTKLAAGMRIPMGRAGRADEFADLAAYLLSPRSSYVTGSAVNLDGGLSPAL